MSQAREQTGFQRGYSTVDNLQSVNQVIVKSNESKMPLSLAFIDYTKAFDSLRVAICDPSFGTSNNPPCIRQPYRAHLQQ